MVNSARLREIEGQKYHHNEAVLCGSIMVAFILYNKLARFYKLRHQNAYKLPISLGYWQKSEEGKAYV